MSLIIHDNNESGFVFRPKKPKDKDTAESIVKALAGCREFIVLPFSQSTICPLCEGTGPKADNMHSEWNTRCHKPTCPIYRAIQLHGRHRLKSKQAKGGKK